MFRSLLAAVRSEVSGDRALADVRSIAAFHRIQSSPGYDEAAAWVAEAAGRAGLAVTVETAPGDGRSRRLGQLLPEGWTCSRAAATLLDGSEGTLLADYAAEPLSLIQRSAPARGRFRLVAVDGGDSAADYEGLDVRGAVVLGSAPAHRMLDLAVRARGAAGLLCYGRRLVPPVREAGTDVDSIAYTSFWWSGDEPRGWGFVVSPRRGEELRDRLRAGARLEVEVEIDSRRFAAPIPLVTAVLPGAGGADAGEVLVLSHLCHPRPSANDNASGVACALECARTLAALLRRGRAFVRGVRFLWMPELTGTFAWLGGGADRATRTVAALNLDMVGEDQEACGSTFLMEHPPWFTASFAEELLGRIRAEAPDWVTNYSGPGHYGLARMAEVPYSGGSDHAVLVDPAVGVPCPMLIQWPDRYYHSNLDTPGKCDPRSLALAARCAAAYAGFLAGAGPAETSWLLGAVERGARRRLLAAVDAEDAPRAMERETRRGRQAIASLGRLACPAPAIDAAADRWLRFAEAEAQSLHPGSGSGPAPSPHDARIPRRREPGPLDFLDHLVDGWEQRTPEEREAWRAVRARHPDPLFEIAWFACDGARDLGAIARLTWLETGRHEPEGIATFFEWTARLGRSEWVHGADGG